MGSISEETLSHEIEKIAELAFYNLFQLNEEFYYCSLITTGNALPPIIVAWSYEALERYMLENNCESFEKEFIKWSYTESPYFDYGANYMNHLNQLFLLRPQMDASMSSIEWENEFNTRLKAMENAMHRLDAKGIFGVGDARFKIVINVEVMPPDYENTLRAMRLNPVESLSEWLEEAAEPLP